MRKIVKIFGVIIIILSLMFIVANNIYTDSIECDNNTIIISVCTGNMRALETGVSVYAGYNGIPLILSDKTMPEQLNSWLPIYLSENNITKIIVVGPVTAEQLYNFMKFGVEVKQINGNSISEILTKIAQNTEEINKDEIIITASDPLAGELGAYMKHPVFVTATNSTYLSDEYLDNNYIDYIKQNHVKNAIIVGNIPNSIKTQLQKLNVTTEEISGHDSLDVSRNINNVLKTKGYTNNSTIAYYGFYGELPTIIPTLIKNNGILLEDSSNTGEIIQYLKENNIKTVFITRNTESDYIQMEETDYISSDVINNLEKNNISIKYLTKNRTLDEATGLYDMKIITAEFIENKHNNITKTEQYINIKTEPPLIEMLKEKECIDSNNISASIKTENNEYIVKWDTIHPYIWKKINDYQYYATSNTGYEYFWTKEDNLWKVQYKFNNTNYYNITWIENENSSWTEIHDKKNFTWRYDGTKWNCYNNNSELIYYISKI